MTTTRLMAAAVLLASLGATLSAHAYDADWKRGRVYYRSVCTSCHTAQPVGQINPNARTKAEWSTYMLLDKHAKGKDAVSKYVSKAYRASIKASNKAAEKFADVPDKELLEDIRSFLIRGAKDGESPATCS